MPRTFRTPQELIEPILRFVAPSSGREPAGPSTEQRILDAALAAFTEHGVRATTMATVARDAGVSREWLYKLFANRDALVLAVTRREVASFIDGLAVRAFGSSDFTAAVTDVFVYAVEYLRDHALLQRVVWSETDVLSPRLLDGAPSLVALAVDAGAAYLANLGDMEPARAAMLAETLVRLVGSSIVVPRGALDLHDPETLRRYAEAMIPAVVAGAQSAPLPTS